MQEERHNDGERFTRMVSGFPRWAACVAILMGVVSIGGWQLAVRYWGERVEILGACLGGVALVGGVGTLFRLNEFRRVAIAACWLQLMIGAVALSSSWLAYGLLVQTGSYWVVLTRPPYHISYLYLLLVCLLSLLGVVLLFARRTRDACQLRQRWRRLARGVCPTCVYDLRGNTSGVCPECCTPLTMQGDPKMAASAAADFSEGRGMAVLFMGLMILVVIVIGGYAVSQGFRRSQTPLGADCALKIAQKSPTRLSVTHQLPTLPSVLGGGVTLDHESETGYGYERIVFSKQATWKSVDYVDLQLYKIAFTDSQEGAQTVHDTKLHCGVRSEISVTGYRSHTIVDQATGRVLVSPFVLEPGDHHLKILVPAKTPTSAPEAE